MSKPIFWLIIVAIVVLGFFGFEFCSDATSYATPTEGRTPAVVAGVTCLILSTALLVTLVFASGNRE